MCYCSSIPISSRLISWRYCDRFRVSVFCIPWVSENMQRKPLSLPRVYNPHPVNPVVCCPVCVGPPPFPVVLPSFPTPLLPAPVTTARVGHDGLRLLPSLRQPMLLTRMAPMPQRVPVTATFGQRLLSVPDPQSPPTSYSGTNDVFII